MKYIIKNTVTQESFVIEDVSLNKTCSVKKLKEMVSEKTQLGEDKFLLIYGDKLLDNQFQLGDYGINNIDYIELYLRDNRYLKFMKNSQYIFFFGVVFGVGHMIAGLVLKHGFDDVLLGLTKQIQINNFVMFKKESLNSLPGTEERNPNQVSQYKLFLFQEFYPSIKFNFPIQSLLDQNLQSFVDAVLARNEFKIIFQKIIEFYSQNRPYDAIFFSEKLAFLLDSNIIAVYLLGECYYLNGDYVKVNYLFHKGDLLDYNENFVLLGAKSFLGSKQYEQTIQLLKKDRKESTQDKQQLGEIEYLFGKCNQILENQEESEVHFKESLELQPESFETLQQFIQVNKNSVTNMDDYVSNIQMPEGLEWLRAYNQFYISHQKKEVNRDQNVNFQIENSEDYMNDQIIQELHQKEDTDILFLKAQFHFNNYQLNQAFQICCKIVESNFFHFENLLIYSEILVEKKMISDLFTCSTNMSDNYPDHYMNYHLFGMYYYLLKKFDIARKYFNKAIQINKNSIKSWIMLGHSYANQEESEQAMNVYRSCIRLFPNSHLPHLYMGMEYIRINNLKTAYLSFQTAKSLIGPDPIVYNEIGCIYLKEKKFLQARKAFNNALEVCHSDGINWLKHIILNNLGHAHRKYKEYPQAIICYEESLILCPDVPNVLFSLGFCYHLIGEYEKAISLYHKVVIMKYDTHFVNHMLVKCLQDLTDSLQCKQVK